MGIGDNWSPLAPAPDPQPPIPLYRFLNAQFMLKPGLQQVITEEKKSTRYTPVLSFERFKPHRKSQKSVTSV